MASLKIATQPPANLDDFVRVPAASSMAPPVSAAQIKGSGLNDLAYAPTPSPLATSYEQLSQWQRPGVSQFRIPPLGARSSSAIIATIKQVSTQTIVETAAASGSFLPLAGGTLTGPLIIASSASPSLTVGGPSQFNAAATFLNSSFATGYSNQFPAPSFGFQGQYWTGSASAADTWTFSHSLAGSNVPSEVSTLTLAHAGAPGILTIAGINQFNVSGQSNLGSVVASSGISQGTAFGNGTAWSFASVTAGVGTATYFFTNPTTVGTFPNSYITFAGFSNGANNGRFIIQSVNTTQVVVYNGSAINESHAATGTLDAGYGSTGRLVSMPGNLNFPIEGTTYTPGQFIQSVPNTPGLTLALAGDATDAAYLRILNNGSTGAHGLELAAIIDGTGAAPVIIQLGVFSGHTGVVLPAIIGEPTYLGETLGIGNGANTNLQAPAKNTGSGPASLVVVEWEQVSINGATYWRALYQ